MLLVLSITFDQKQMTTNIIFKASVIDCKHRKSRYTQPLVIRSIGDVKICVTMISLDDTSKASRVCYIIDMERAWSDAARHTQRANRRKIQQT